MEENANTIDYYEQSEVEPPWKDIADGLTYVQEN